MFAINVGLCSNTDLIRLRQTFCSFKSLFLASMFTFEVEVIPFESLAT